MSEPIQIPESAPTSVGEVVSPEEKRIKRILTISLVAFALLLVGMITLMVVLAVDAYSEAPEPSPGAVVVSLIRDAAIVLVAFETMVIGVLLVVLMLQMQALVVLLRDEIRPMLEAVNETVATVRGTALFVSENVVTPTVRAAGFMAGLRRVIKEVTGLVRFSQPRDEEEN